MTWEVASLRRRSWASLVDGGVVLGIVVAVMVVLDDGKIERICLKQSSDDLCEGTFTWE